MRINIKAITFLMAITSLACNKPPEKESLQAVLKEGNRKPTVSFTFDDGLINDIVNYKFEDWNHQILNTLEEADLKAFFFIATHNKKGEKGKYLLESWNEKGHKLANHTLSHPNFHDKNNTAEDFEDELLYAESVISPYENFVRYFRFPYLKEGRSRAKIDSIRSILEKHNYRNGYVTIDASDWFINSRLINHMKYRQKVDTSAFEKYYLDHIIDRAKYYESLSFELNERHINHTLLLHHNLTSALFLKKLIKRFIAEGWQVIDAEEAYTDPIFEKTPSTVPAGESLIWSLAKESGLYDDKLRYPAEDSRYEQPKMDSLNL